MGKVAVGTSAVGMLAKSLGTVDESRAIVFSRPIECVLLISYVYEPAMPWFSKDRCRDSEDIIAASQQARARLRSETSETKKADEELGNSTT
jgi:hypothetical protein